jgi:hypothetical protein
VLQKEHEERTKGSPDFLYLKQDIAALDAIRSEKTLSLSIKVREAERERQDADRLARENALRAAHDQPPLKSLEDLKDDAAAGIILDETSQIAADFAVQAAHHGAVTTQAKRIDAH